MFLGGQKGLVVRKLPGKQAKTAVKNEILGEELARERIWVKEEGVLIKGRRFGRFLGYLQSRHHMHRTFSLKSFFRCRGKVLPGWTLRILASHGIGSVGSSDAYQSRKNKRLRGRKLTTAPYIQFFSRLILKPISAPLGPMHVMLSFTCNDLDGITSASYGTSHVMHVMPYPSCDIDQKKE